MRIFVSSTFLDLRDYRKEVEGVLGLFDQVYRGMEYFGASSRTSLQSSLKVLGQCELVVCIVGTRYGSVTASGVSYTQAEVAEAHRLGIPILAFLLDEDQQPVLAKFVSAGQERKALELFKDWLKRICLPDTFTTPQDLAVRLSAALFRDVKVSAPGRGAISEIMDRAAGATRTDLDVLAVTAHNLDSIHRVDRLAADHEAMASDPVLSPGGSGANTASAIRKLGRSAAVAGIVAKDEAGLALKEDLASRKIALDALIEVPRAAGTTGRATIFIDDLGQRSIFVFPGVNAQWAQRMKQKNRIKSLLSTARRSRIIHFSSFTSDAERALEEDLMGDIDQTALVSFTPGALYAKLGLDRLAVMIGRANFLFLYEEQLNSLLSNSSVSIGDAAAPLPARVEAVYLWKARHHLTQPLLVVVKRNVATNRGSGAPLDLVMAAGREQLEELMPPRAANSWSRTRDDATDTTGAGDALAGAVLFGMLERRTLTQCADLAFVTAALTSRGIGARKRLPTRSALLSHLSKK